MSIYNIKSAVWGTVGGGDNGSTNCTTELTNYLNKRNSNTFDVNSHALGTDPAYGKQKYFSVLYEVDGLAGIFTAVSKDGEQVVLEVGK
ncbi:hypothetical protein [Pseudoalteromonas byunsanensis]|uniref:Uncharacterized protein n=1 Tax=Pseudoalteromonas byunsanensis TaxID=327939 RepID=A0A1S1N4M4_9GAMM|nr:hypothetical protein [Pseudoalteromonas byunsanensis]OHU94946.1 hypothetical protein BIW53_13080 [Pseudoalteromonas byunsanensis]